MTVIDRTAPTEHPILDVLTRRWSPRAFDPVEIDEAKLSSALEAARWSPSAYNAQPWRFVMGHRGTETFDRILSVLVEFNQGWARNASVLLIAVAEVSDENGREQPTAVYDLGQSVAHLSVQAHADDLVVHQMSGFDADAARTTFALPDRFTPVAVVALGSLAHADTLADEGLREGERAPRARRPLQEILLEA